MRYPLALRRAVLAFALVPGVGAAAAAQVPRAEEASPEAVARGAELFSRFCQRCHNAPGPAERTAREWVIIMQHMSVRADLTRTRAGLIRAFLLSSSGAAGGPGVRAVTARGRDPSPEEITPAMIEAGREIYGGVGACAACHGARLEGGPTAPDLRDSRWRHGSGRHEDILGVIRAGVPGTTMAAYPGGISDEEAILVAAYVWAVASGRADPQ